MLFFVCQFRKFPIVRGLFQPLLKLLVEAAVLNIHPGILVIDFLGTDRKLVLFLFPAIHIFLDAQLVEKLKEMRAELFNLRFQMATSQLDNTARVNTVKKDIARVLTEQRAREIAAEKSAVAE